MTKALVRRFSPVQPQVGRWRPGLGRRLHLEEHQLLSLFPCMRTQEHTREHTQQRQRTRLRNTPSNVVRRASTHVCECPQSSLSHEGEQPTKLLHQTGPLSCSPTDAAARLEKILQSPRRQSKSRRMELLWQCSWTENYPQGRYACCKIYCRHSLHIDNCYFIREGIRPPPATEPPRRLRQPSSHNLL